MRHELGADISLLLLLSLLIPPDGPADKDFLLLLPLEVM